MNPKYQPSPSYQPQNKSQKGLILGCLGVLFLGLFLVVAGFVYVIWADRSVRHPDYYGKIVNPKEQVVHYGLKWESVNPKDNQTEPLKTLDPQSSDSPDQIVSALFDGLVIYDSGGETLKPSLAAKWEKNSDSTLWTFYLRKDAKWSDGKPITANDFVYSWKRALDGKNKFSNSPLFFGIKNGENFSKGNSTPDDLGIKATDEYTLQISLSQPTPYFDKLLVNKIFFPVPQQSIEKFGNDWTKEGNIISSGAFRLSEWKSGQQIVLERNSDFWDNANTKLDKIIFPSPIKKYLGILNPKTFLEQYEDGKVDVTHEFSDADDSITQKKDFLFDSYNSNEFVFLNVKVKPLDDPRVRRALSMAIDREKFKLKVLKSSRALTSFTPPIQGYENPKGNGYNPDEAKRLLNDAGFPNGKGFPAIEYFYNTTESNRDIALFLQEQWQKELNIKVNLVNLPWKDFFEKSKAKNFKGMARSGWVGDCYDPYDFLQLINSEFNYSGWEDPKYIEMLKKSNLETDEKKRYLLLNEAETYLLEQQPVIPLFWGVNSILVKPYIKNLAPNRVGRINWREVYLDGNISANSL